MRSFRAGLCSRGPAGFILGLFFFLSLAALTETLLRSGAIRYLPEAWLLLSPTDQFTHVAHQIASLPFESSAELPIYLIGGSATRECVDDERRIEIALARRLRETVKLHNLSHFQQSYAEATALIGKLPEGRGLLVLGTNLFRLTVTSTESDNTHEGLLSALRHRWATPFFLRYLAEYLSSRRSTLVRGRIAAFHFQPHFYSKETQLSQRGKNELQHKVREAYLPRFEANANENLGALATAVAAARAKGIRVALLELPDNPSFPIADDQTRARYSDLLQAFVAKQKLPYWNFNSSLHLTDDDFQDLSHLIGVARQRFAADLIKATAKVITKGEG